MVVLVVVVVVVDEPSGCVVVGAVVVVVEPVVVVVDAARVVVGAVVVVEPVVVVEVVEPFGAVVVEPVVVEVVEPFGAVVVEPVVVDVVEPVVDEVVEPVVEGLVVGRRGAVVVDGPESSLSAATTVAGGSSRGVTSIAPAACRPPTASTPTIAVGAAAVTAADIAPEPIVGSSATLRSNGTCVSAESGPIAKRRWRKPIERNARTASGENCVPAQLVISARASAIVSALRYGRGVVITSNASATAMIAADRPMRSPERLRG